MNHPRDPKALRTFNYNPTAAEVAEFASTEDVQVRTEDVLTVARAMGGRLSACLVAGRVDRMRVSTVAFTAQELARERLLRGREVRSIADQVWEQTAYGPQGRLA